MSRLPIVRSTVLGMKQAWSRLRTDSNKGIKIEPWRPTAPKDGSLVTICRMPGRVLETNGIRGKGLERWGLAEERHQQTGPRKEEKPRVVLAHHR